jgi:O-antigen/teichoic acid export membrane protein
MALLKHTAYNLIGLGAPLLVAVFSIPPLIDTLGAARFGLLTLVWAVVSYFGLFDLGLGRALTQQLSAAWARHDERLAGRLAGTGLLLMATVGALAGVAVALLASWGVDRLQAVPDRDETVRAVYAMALAMPAIVLTTGLRGVLEARAAFGIVNLIRLPMGLFTFLGPLAVVFLLGPRLDLVAYALCAGRIVACLIHARFAFTQFPAAARLQSDWSLVRHLLASGGWLSVSNIISPLMGYADRFIIGLLVSTAAVAYYVTPQELVTKLWIIPGALTSVLFPAFAAHAVASTASGRALFNRALGLTYSVVLPIAASVALFARELLTLWLGADLALHSGTALQIFAVGMFINCLATIPYTLLQGSGKARTTALIHLLQLPAFLGALWFLTARHGLEGALFAWMLRTLVDTALMFHYALQALNETRRLELDRHTLLLAAGAMLAFGGLWIPSAGLRASLLACVWLAVVPMQIRHFRGSTGGH